MRDITLEDTIYPRFTTRAFATGIPTTLAGTPVLSIYEENNLTQITAGVSVSVDYDTVTGLNQATIVATAANGYEAGKSYDLVITTGTVGGVSVVGEVVGSFTIASSAAAIQIGAAGAGLTAINLPNQTMDITGNLSGSVGSVTGNVGGVAGTINTLDALDTAQDTQHSTTQSAIGAAQTDLNTITGADGATLASTQGAITYGAITYSVTGATNNITFAGSGSGDVFALTRSGSGDLFNTAYATDFQANVNAACDLALTDYDAATGTEIAALNDVAATDIVSAGPITTSAGAVVNVDTVDTCATNTDMRGTDSAATEAKQDATDLVIAELTSQGDTNETAINAVPTAAQNRTEMDSNSTQLNTTLPALIDDLAIKKNTVGLLHIEMVLSSDHVTPATGLTVTAQRLIDSGVYAAVTGTMTEISNGTYRFDYTAADSNGDIITWRFSSATADDTKATFKTVAQ